MVTLDTLFQERTPLEDLPIQFAARASMHDPRYKKPYFKIPRAAWLAYKMERLLGSLVNITIHELGENHQTKLVHDFYDHLVEYQGSARIVMGMWHDLEIGNYYIIQVTEASA